MNVWAEIIRPGILALFYSALFFIPAWLLYKWAGKKDRLGILRQPVRLLIILVTGGILIGSGGGDSLSALERWIGIGDPTIVDDDLFIRLAYTILILVGAWLLARLLDLVVFDFYMSRRGERAVPKLLRDTLLLVIIVITLVLILIYIFNFNAAWVGGGAAVITVVLGLALQNVLGDLFSGVVLQFEHPFRHGDWIIVGEHEGEIVEINWRATRLRTRQNIGIVIPNSVIAKAEIQNLNLDTPSAAVDRFVGTEYKEPPNRVKGAIMEGILQCGDVLRQPAPRVWTHEYGDHAIIYRMRFWVRDFEKVPKIADDVLTNIWYVFKRYDITIPWPIRNVYMRTEERPTLEETMDSVTGLLRQVDIFTPLSREQIEALAEGLIPKFFGRGEVLVKQGEEGNSFFIIEQGRVEVLITPEGSTTEASVAVLGPRDFFGEMSLLAGDKRTATVKAIEDVRVIIIDKDSFSRIIHENPEVAAEMAACYMQRTQELTAVQERLVEGEEAVVEEDTGERALLRRIQRFFGL